jgi:hypothetical protein
LPWNIPDGTAALAGLDLVEIGDGLLRRVDGIPGVIAAREG